MELNLLKYMAFVKTVELGSFTKAAQILNYSQSGISRMIGDLEREWGVALLERNRSGVWLTSDGKRMLPYARDLCDEYARLQMKVDELNGLQSGLIRIGVFSSVATHWLPNIIQAFQKDYPNIEYELHMGHYKDIEQWILEGRVDCGFVRLPAGKGLDTIFLEQDRVLAVLPEGHKLAKRKKVKLESLCDEPFMLLEEGSGAEFTELFEKANLAPNVKFRTLDDYAIMAMVEKGLGVSILPELILKRVSYKIAVRELNVPAVRKIALAVREKKRPSLAVEKFITYLDYRNSN